MKKIWREQEAYFATGKTKSITHRKEALRKIKDLLQQNEQKLYDAIYIDFKKSEFETYTSELALVYHDIDEALKNIKKWSKPKCTATNWLNMPGSSKIYPEPLGCTLVIGAWNYPYLLSLAPTVAAIAAGCTVVLKPSELPIHTSNVMAHLINSSFDAGLLHVVEGGIPETTSLLELSWDKIFFTGSIPVGKIVYQAAAKNLVPVTLELGGKSPAIITPNCKLSVSVKRLVWAKFLNAGQTCVAPDYVLVHTDIVDEFIKETKEQILQSEYAPENHNYVQIINEKNLKRVASLIDTDKVVYGGDVNTTKRTISPTLLYPASPEDACMQEEIFGPILPIIPYTNLEDALAVIRKMSKPLSAYIFTEDSNEKETFLSKISFGGGAINDALMHLANSNLPFGGVGQSGMGSYHGKAGFRTFSHYKSILDKSTLIEPNLKHSPMTQTKFNWIKRIFRLG